MTRITFNCPQCHGELAASSALVGAVIACPLCRAAVVVPDSGSSRAHTSEESPRSSASAPAPVLVSEPDAPPAPRSRIATTLGKSAPARPAASATAPETSPASPRATAPLRKSAPGTRLKINPGNNALFMDESERSAPSPSRDPRVARRRRNFLIGTFLVLLALGVLALLFLYNEQPNSAKMRELERQDSELSRRAQDTDLNLRPPAPENP